LVDAGGIAEYNVWFGGFHLAYEMLIAALGAAM
jgi:hypothetical protein